MNTVKTFVLLALVSFLAGCGGMRKESVGVSEDTALLIMAERLVGAEISTSDKRMQVTKASLRPYEIGVWGVKDSEAEKMETFVLDLDQGTHEVQVRLPDGHIMTKTFYLSDGQIRTWMIK